MKLNVIDERVDGFALGRQAGKLAFIHKFIPAGGLWRPASLLAPPLHSICLLILICSASRHSQNKSNKLHFISAHSPFLQFHSIHPFNSLKRLIEFHLWIGFIVFSFMNQLLSFSCRLSSLGRSHWRCSAHNPPKDKARRQQSHHSRRAGAQQAAIKNQINEINFICWFADCGPSGIARHLIFINSIHSICFIIDSISIPSKFHKFH